ncbi:unnamed protein product [Lymnaea stagnalis]|uniref:L antigen family member 3 n=1 Tax=Lymnaea stagnalis TaxID=6523 RepID=A0AAV2HIQ9_LYMST
MSASIITANLEIPFPTDREAEIAHGSLSVDKEPKRGGVKKTMTVHNNIMHIHFAAPEARLLRVSINSFFDHLKLVVETLERFGQPR